MSQAIRGGIILLAALLVIAIGVSVVVLIQKKAVEEQVLSLQDQLTEANKKQEKASLDLKKLQEQTDDLGKRLRDTNKQKDDLQSAYDDYKRKFDDLSAQKDQLNQERDSWRNRYEKSRKELEQAVEQLKNQQKEVQITKTEAAPVAAAAATPTGASDEYWAEILKQKAELQVQLDKAKTELNNDALIVADLRKQTTDLQLQIKDLNSDKEEITRRLENEKKSLIDSFTKERQDVDREKQNLLRKIRDGEDLANNLSMEAARARGDQKNANDYLSKIKEDNVQLQSQVRQLVSTKVALEKTVARLTDQKAEISKRLTETEGVIQDRINEIWQIKNTLDQKITQINDAKNNYKEMELAPIVVNSSGKDSGDSSSGQTYKVISLNEKNNFVIIDYGETQGSKVGRGLKVYRDNKEIATLEVIQVRRDISAADIKVQSTKLQVGDQVR